MGGCLSKKKKSTEAAKSASSVAAAAAKTPSPDLPTKPKQEEQIKTPTTPTPPSPLHKQDSFKKEVFIIKQRKSHERRPEDKPKIAPLTPKKKLEVSSPTSSASDVAAAAAAAVANGSDGGASNRSGFTSGGGGGGGPVRTSSCTKEEVDAILIQCGRLSRSSSGKGDNSGSTRKYSGSKKRSYDFDHDEPENNRGGGVGDDFCGNEDNRRRHHSRPSHRRTPSRERDLESKRSNSRDRYSSSRDEEGGRARSNNGGGSSSRRVSRSPGRRSETNATGTGAATDNKLRPGKMVSVPASASGTTGIKRVNVKRSGEVGHQRTTAASPRSQSPANANARSQSPANANARSQSPANARPCNENVNAHHQQQPTLSRNNSRKAEQSPYRRNPMSELDDNCLNMKSHDQNHFSNNKVQKVKETEHGAAKKPFHLQSQKPDGGRHNKVVEHGQVTNNNSSRDVEENISITRAEMQRITVEDNVMEAKGVPLKTSKALGAAAAAPGSETLNPPTITRSRSSRRSRDFDLNMGFNPDTLLNPTSYASLLLEDIQNFHQQNTTTTFTLPQCVTKACSILDAVADLNSSTSSNLSTTFSEDRTSEADRYSKNTKSNVPFSTHNGKRRVEVKDPFVESELAVSDDIMEPSLHKYITVRRGVTGGEMEQQESSGSNSFIGQQWAPSSSSWEPNSADSTDRWTSRSNNSGEDAVMDREEKQHTLKCHGISTPLPSLTPTGRKTVGARGSGGQMKAPTTAAASM